MQYLKEEIKQKILAAALQEFQDKGFLGASMRNIAGNAGVAIGNVYRYFKNKDELFNEIMEPVYTEFIFLVFNVGKAEKPGYNFAPLTAQDITDKVMEVYRKYGTQLLIMMDKSKGSKFENLKEELVQLVDSRLKNELLPIFSDSGIEIRDQFITYVIAATFVEGIFLILHNYTDEAKIKYLTNQLINLYFMDIVYRWK